METTSIKVSLKKRTAAQIEAKVAVSHPDVPEYTCTLDFSKLSEEQVLLWAARGVKIHIQSQLASGAMKEVPEIFVVKESGDRQRLDDATKIRRMVAGLLGKSVEDVSDDDVRKVMSLALVV